MNTNHWADYWEALRVACQQHIATDRKIPSGQPLLIEIGPPATETEVITVEKTLGMRLPQSLRHVFQHYSARLSISWQLPEGVDPPKPFDQIFSGEIHWDLYGLPELQDSYQSWIENCFSDPDNAYDAVWHNKFSIAEVVNGDFLGIDMTLPDGPVVYLSHDDGEGHGYHLGSNFADFVDRFARIGCAGLEDWQWLPFTSGPKSLIDPDCPNARAWRQWFGLKIE